MEGLICPVGMKGRNLDLDYPGHNKAGHKPVVSYDRYGYRYWLMS